MLQPGPRAQQAWGRGHEVKGKLGVGERLGVRLRKGPWGKGATSGQDSWWGWAGSRQRET